MKPSLRTALCTLVMASLLPSAWSGPLIDAIKERREKRREAAEAAESKTSTDELDSSDSETKSRLALPSGARALMDQRYGPDGAHKLDVYIPNGAKGAPILFMVHGGAWMVGDKAASKVVANKVARWLPKGYIVASVNYRMSRQPKVMDQVDDVARALAFVQSHAADWGGDGARVLVLGHSSGAHLVSLLASDSKLASQQGAKPWLGTVSLDSAAFNVVDIMSSKHYGFYDRVFGKEREFWEQASPYYRLTGALASPMLIVCSARRSDSCPQAQAYAGKASGLGSRVTVLPVDLAHGDVNGQLGTAGDYTTRVETFMRGVGLP
ncbi:alpha/beta hydrolase [Aquabacterium sp.]|uniref:alpha/beta hydrolase n=1 Tax=Aquabacterium sp. TaxID=1872578 RepID=UPI002CDC672B|nr:alpha/beta hydrolase [Aquabacterium sp.]HSW07009.1 alpha/beta hydrolase [Aquabacterium sp.]